LALLSALARRSRATQGRRTDMRPFWRVFLSIFCYVAAVVGIGLAVLNASAKPPATVVAVIFGGAGAVLLAAGVVLTRKPHY